jgi:FG-GAP-like repeat
MSINKFRLPRAEKVYNKDCPDGPYIDFSGGGAQSVVFNRASSDAPNPTSGQSSNIMDFASLNADGNTDVVALSDTGLTVQFLDDTFSTLSMSQIKVSTSLYSVIAADVNGDGFPDLVAVDGGNGTSGSNGGVWISPNQKNGTFGTPVEFQRVLVRIMSLPPISMATESSTWWSRMAGRVP